MSATDQKERMDESMEQGLEAWTDDELAKAARGALRMGYTGQARAMLAELASRQGAA